MIWVAASRGGRSGCAGASGINGRNYARPLSMREHRGRSLQANFLAQQAATAIAQLRHRRAPLRGTAAAFSTQRAFTRLSPVPSIQGRLQAATTRCGPACTIAQDDVSAICDASEDHSREAEHVADREGQMVQYHFGERAYVRTENVI